VPAVAGLATPALVGRRTTKITKCACPTTSHLFNNDTSGQSSPGYPRPGWSAGYARAGSYPRYGPDGLIRRGSTLGDVRLTEFWNRMNAQFGDVYAQSVAKDFVFDKLGGRTVERALADGVDAKVVWRAVCDTFKVPENPR
jgi:Protein of unknown function (DUF3046)